MKFFFALLIHVLAGTSIFSAKAFADEYSKAIDKFNLNVTETIDHSIPVDDSTISVSNNTIYMFENRRKLDNFIDEFIDKNSEKMRVTNARKKFTNVKLGSMSIQKKLLNKTNNNIIGSARNFKVYIFEHDETDKSLPRLCYLLFSQNLTKLKATHKEVDFWNDSLNRQENLALSVSVQLSRYSGDFTALTSPTPLLGDAFIPPPYLSLLNQDSLSTNSCFKDDEASEGSLLAVISALNVPACEAPTNASSSAHYADSRPSESHILDGFFKMYFPWLVPNFKHIGYTTTGDVYRVSAFAADDDNNAAARLDIKCQVLKEPCVIDIEFFKKPQLKRPNGSNESECFNVDAGYPLCIKRDMFLYSRNKITPHDVLRQYLRNATLVPSPDQDKKFSIYVSILESRRLIEIHGDVFTLGAQSNLYISSCRVNGIETALFQ